MDTWTPEQGARKIAEIRDDTEPSAEEKAFHDTVLGSLNEHLRAGKSVAYYCNEDLGHPMIGHVVAFTYGRPEAQFEGEPPEQCPDGLMPKITGGINWRYRLIAVTKALPVISEPVI